MTMNEAIGVANAKLRRDGTPGKPVSYKDFQTRVGFFVSQSTGKDKEVGQKMLVVNKVTREAQWVPIRKLGMAFLMTDTVDL